MPDRLFTPELFTPHLESTFIAQGSHGEVELRLVDVDVKPGNRPDHAFTIEFLGPTEPFLPQRIYHLLHGELAAMDLFLVPVGERDRGYVYEAVFTRLD